MKRYQLKDIFHETSETTTRGVLYKKVFLEISQNLQKNICARVSFVINFIKKETMGQVFSFQFCEISKNTFIYRTPLVAASLWLL